MKKHHRFLSTIFLFLCSVVHAQENADTTERKLNEVVITGIQNDAPKNTSLNIEPYSLKKLEAKSPLNLSDALAQLPGISQMTTGNSISKPVIRGMYGNRLLVLLSGLRFDNQQFQDEHGLGLSQIGIDRVEVIRGPASLLYGTDAIGGVINVIEETPDHEGKVLDINTRLYSNTLGTLTDIGFSSYKNDKVSGVSMKDLVKQFVGVPKGRWWRVRAGVETHADYSDGSGQRVENSRNKGYYFKAGAGFNHDHWEMNNAYNFSYSQFGFILEDLGQFFQHDARYARSMENPHHNVMLNILSSQNTFYLNRKRYEDAHKGSLLKLNLGFQSNKRAEDEGGGEISLNMHLVSILESARLEKYITKKSMLVVSQQFTFEKNINLGKRILIPDANMPENNLSIFYRYLPGDKLTIEAGVGGNVKQIHTYKTGILNTPDKDIQPFNITRSTVNGMAGFSYSLTARSFLKANISTGARAANLAELASDGVHEGSLRFEIGDPNLRSEQNVNVDLTFETSRKTYFISASAYYNKFFNYIYLSPTNKDRFGYQVFYYLQQNANIYGGELVGIYKPINGLQVKEVFSAIQGVTEDKQNLPFIPAWKSQTSVRYEKTWMTKWKSWYIEPELEYVLAQNNPAQFETSTPDYALVHLHTGIVTVIGHHDINWNLSCRNLLDKKYVDHLARIKYYGLYNEGINFILSVSTKLGIK